MIECAAIKTREGKVYALCRPNRHCNVLWFADDEQGEYVRGEIQGFLTDRGEFMNRCEAAMHAIACGQIALPIQVLYSEDVWDGNADIHDDGYGRNAVREGD